MAFDDEEDAAIPEAAEYTAGQGSPGPQQAPSDNSGMGPVEAIPPADNSGMGPVAAAPAAPEGAPAQAPGGKPKRFGPLAGIVSYLMGEDADNPAVLQQAAAQVDPRQQMSRGDANLLAVEQAAARGGDEAAWKLVQANRVAYNAKQAFAYAALNGTQQKPPDLNAAVDAANQAGEHVLDGNNVKFMASQAGQITATVTPPGGGQPQIIDLSPDQFRQYLNVGRTGQWDRVMQDGIPGTLQKLAQAGGGRQGAPPQARARTMPSAQPEEAIPTAPDNNETNFGKTPSTLNLSGSNQRSAPTKDVRNYGAELEARADRMFPGITQEAQKQQWMAAQEGQEQERENKLNISNNTGLSRVAVAEQNADARRDVEGVKAGSNERIADVKAKGWQYASDAKKAIAQINADQKAAHDGNLDARQRLESARKTIATKRMTAEKLTPEETELEKQLQQGGAQAAGQLANKPAPAAQQQQRPQAQATQAQQPSGKDAQAIAWANANPDDPRAAKIKQRLGVQ